MRPGGGLGGGWGSSQDLAAAPWEPTTWGHSEEEQLPASWIDKRWPLGGHKVDTWSPDIGASRGTPKVFCCWYFSYKVLLLLLLALVSFLQPLASDPGGGAVYRWYLMPFQRCNIVNVVISICVTTEKLPSPCPLEHLF